MESNKYYYIIIIIIPEAWNIELPTVHRWTLVSMRMFNGVVQVELWQ
jgi:hypothetical protein